ncbi:hypothetical protein SK128_011251 [Halocaridina rubra]|uniref:RZZ complex subunit KNTC1/ROD C-terminal domain-containing protein n=1 Tax=Halocaridina rubra TaxID=373956 RepID=A0AAN8WKV5_HALRR
MILAEEWKENCTDTKAAEAYERMNSRYTQLAVEHALHKYGLAKPKYISLKLTLNDLIFTLYQHPSLHALATLNTYSMPDINSCVSDICSVAGFRPVSNQSDLLEKWLPPPESVEGLWRSQRPNPQALTLVTDLYCDYKVMTASLWGAFLTQLTNILKLGQVVILTLERILLQIQSLSHLWVVPAFTTAWTAIINYPFLKASSPISESSLSACVHSIDLLLRHCLVVLLMAPLLKHCTNLYLPVLALATASADQVESQDIRAMAEKILQSKLFDRYDKLKQLFSIPRHVEDVIECLKERVELLKSFCIPLAWILIYS